MIHPFVDDLLRACPSVASAWRDHLTHWGDEPDRGVFNDIAVVAHHVADAAAKGDFGPADMVLAFVEMELGAPVSDRVQLCTGGIIEDLLLIASHVEGLTQRLAARCGPRTQGAWAEVERMWDGVGSLAEMIRKERGRESL